MLQGLTKTAYIVVQNSIVDSSFITACGSLRFKMRLH